MGDYLGESVPFLRSDENSIDTADSWSVVKEVVHEYEKDVRNMIPYVYYSRHLRLEMFRT